MNYEDLSETQKVVLSLAHADHMGDVNNDMERLCALLDLEIGEWDDERECWAFPWEPVYDDEDE
jgi:hypothetical protein